MNDTVFAQQDFQKKILYEYDFFVKKITVVRDYFIVDSSSGKRVLRRSVVSPERIWFIHAAKEHLFTKGFCNIDRFICTQDGIPYISYDGVYYTITELTQGRECDFDNNEDVIKASVALASMHTCSRGFKPPKQYSIKSDLGNLPLQFSKRLEEIKRVKKAAQKEKGSLDYLILQYVDYFYALGEEAIGMLKRSDYNALVKKTYEEGLFCHHDYTHSNIIIDNDITSVINFALCSFELKIYDLANLLRRKLRKCDWDVNEAKVIVDAYRTVEPISEEEFYVMRIMLQFPQKFWRVVNKYYNSRRCWRNRTFERKFNEVIDEIECHKRFLERYDSLY